MTNNIFYKYKLRVSTLSHIEFCAKRSKIESFGNIQLLPTIKTPVATIIGNRLHFQYSYPYKDFDRVYLRAKLGKDRIFEKVIDDALIRGRYDDLRIIRYDGKKYTSLIEVKTTSKKYLWSREVKAAIRQLEMYMWLMKEDLDKLGYPLWKRSYVEVYSQKNGQLIRRIPVFYNDKIEEWIREGIRKYRGLSRMEIPPYSYCKLCPENVKIHCDWYYLRSMK